MTDREYMNLPVPTEFLRDVTLFLADLERGTTTTPFGSTSSLDPDPETGSHGTARRKTGIAWNADQWVNLENKANVSSARVLTFVGHLPSGEENARPLSALAEEADMSDNELRAALSWLTRYVRSAPEVYPTDSWPFGWKVGKEVDPANPYEFHYWMSDAQRQSARNGLVAWLDADGDTSAP